MAEKLCSLRKIGGGGVPSNLFTCNPVTSAGTSWTDWVLTGVVNDPNGSGVGAMLDPKFGHIDLNGSIAVDMPIPHAYITGRAFAGRNSSGTLIYGGIRLLKNGTLITGATCYGSSSENNPFFRRIETRL